MHPLSVSCLRILPKAEPPVPVKINPNSRLIIAALLESPVTRVDVLSLIDEAPKLHPSIAYISHSIEIQSWNEIESVLLQEFDYLLVLVNLPVQEFEHRVEHHLYCD